MRSRLVAELPASFRRPTLAPLRGQVAVIFAAQPYDPTDRAAIWVYDGQKLLDDAPVLLPPDVSAVASIAGEWPVAIDLVAVGRRNVGEATLETFGLERTGSGWRRREIGALVVRLGEETLGLSYDRRRPFRALHGGQPPSWQPTPPGSSLCGGRAFALSFFDVAAFRGGVAVLGRDCEGVAGVEIFDPSRREGTLQLFPSIRLDPDPGVAPGRLLARDDALWFVSFDSIFQLRADGWRLVTPPSEVRDAAVASDGGLWISIGGGLRRDDGYGGWTEPPVVVGERPGESVLDVEAVPTGGFLVLTDRALYALEGGGL